MADVTAVDEIEVSTEAADPADVPSAESTSDAEIASPDAALSPSEPAVAVTPAAAPTGDAVVEAPKIRKPRREHKAQSSGLTHVVVRSFLGAGVRRWPGEVVDASGWFAERLVDARRLRPITDKDPKPIEAVGRFFINEDSLIAYAASVVDEAVDTESEED